MQKLDIRTLLVTIGEGMDYDEKHSIHGRPGTETIPYLHKKPTTNRDRLIAAYEMIRASGITLEINYDPHSVDVDQTLQARDIRLKAQKEHNAHNTM